MLLKILEIKNYRSLEHIKLDNLQKFNVLIGRNNAGKSSVFLALSQLSSMLRGQAPLPFEVLTNRDPSKSVEIYLTFKPTEKEREAFIDLLIGAGIQIHKEEVAKSPFFRMTQFAFCSVAGRPDLMHLRETKLLAQDGKWAIIQRLGEPIAKNENTSNPDQKFVNLIAAIKVAEGSLRSDSLDIASVPSHVYGVNLQSSQLTANNPTNNSSDVVRTWFYDLLYDFFSSAYFFNPFRHSQAIASVKLTNILAQDGSNLAQVLHSIIANDRNIFEEIEKFIHGALPDVGSLQTPLISDNQIQAVFRIPQGKYNIPLADMGGGIEQLLMVATVLLTTSPENPIFLEEPESHLHAGAQRYLIERLYGERQIFIATHSPTFINLTKPFSLYQVLYKQGRTQISHCDPESLEAVLEDIDVRNSDVLFSDAVLFVEGSGDRDVITFFSEMLNMNVAERNINVLPMGGGRHAERGAPIRSDLLNKISGKAAIPHLFLLDRDERSKKEIHNLETQLGDKVYLLRSRELENYLLVPRAILAALKEKHQRDQSKMERLEEITEEDIQQLIVNTANDLYGIVLIKRIQCEIGGLREGLLSRDAVFALASYASSSELSSLILQQIKNHFEGHLTSIQLDTIIASEKEALDAAWAVSDNQLQLAPGEEILTEVFSKLGSEYRKPKDTVAIAKEMHSDEIDDEIKEVLKKVYKLSP